MADRTRRGRGDGTVHQRADGYWVGQINLGWRTNPDGTRTRKRKTVTATTGMMRHEEAPAPDGIGRGRERSGRSDMNRVGAADIGNAGEFRIFRPLEGHSIEPAPTGYEWVELPGGGGTFGFGPRALVCMDCGGLVAIHEAHTAWHGGQA